MRSSRYLAVFLRRGSLLGQAGSGRLWWKNPADTTWQETREKLPGEMERRLLEVKPDGGSLRFTENGKILTLIEAQPPPKHWHPQYNALNDARKRLIARKVRSTGLLPVLLGEHHGGFTLQPLRSPADPLSAAEEREVMRFLMAYQPTPSTVGDLMDIHDEVEDAIDRVTSEAPADPGSWVPTGSCSR